MLFSYLVNYKKVLTAGHLVYFIHTGIPGARLTKIDTTVEIAKYSAI